VGWVPYLIRRPVRIWLRVIFFLVNVAAAIVWFSSAILSMMFKLS